MKGIVNLEGKNGLYGASSRSVTEALTGDGAGVVIQGSSYGPLEVRAVAAFSTDEVLWAGCSFFFLVPSEVLLSLCLKGTCS